MNAKIFYIFISIFITSFITTFFLSNISFASEERNRVEKRIAKDSYFKLAFDYVESASKIKEDLKKRMLYLHRAAILLNQQKVEDKKDKKSSTLADIIEQELNKHKTRALYINRFHKILGDKDQEDLLIRCIKGLDINAVSIYDLTTIIDGGEKKAQALSDFIIKLKKNGVHLVEAIVGNESAFEMIKKFQTNKLEGKFNAINVEKEFWNEKVLEKRQYVFNDYLKLLKRIKNELPTLSLSTYIGFPDDNELTQLISSSIGIDRLYVHCYVQDLKNAYSYCQNRIQTLDKLLAKSSNESLEILPIFSAENDTNENIFMGKWLTQKRGNTLEKAEKTFIDQFHQHHPCQSYKTMINGFHYFSYTDILNIVSKI
ncbi:MAG: hypothetical protein HQK49_17700 [Oligoflexia bacterium]|nr:hypothetical protein [Oligoflexia bacterium]